MLETIEIDRSQGKSLLLAPGAFDQMLQAFSKQAAIRQAGQGVIVSQVLEFFRGLFLGADIAEYTDIIDHLAAIIADGADLLHGGDHLAVLFAVPDLAPPQTPLGHCLPQFIIKFLFMQPR